MNEGVDAGKGGDRPVMGIREAAAMLGVSDDWVRRWIDANEPDDEHPDRVPVAKVRGTLGRVGRRWRRPYRDAVVAEARRQRGEREPGVGEAPPAAGS